MRLTKEKLIALWKERNTIFTQETNKEIVERYESIKALFDEILKCDFKEDNEAIYIDGEEIIFKDGKRPSKAYFSCKVDEKTAGIAFQGVEIQANSFPDRFKEFVFKIGCMLGGFDFNNHYWMRDEFRIISNSITSKDDNSSLISEGRVRHPSSHFADNNYFFNVIKTVQQIKFNRFVPDNSSIVLRWPNDTYYKNGDDRAEKDQKETLKYRFPYKYFYMWTHEVLHPVSLMAYRNLVQQEDHLIEYPLDKYMNQSYDDFVSEKGWTAYSNAIRDMIPVDLRGDNFWDEVSKFISVLMTHDQSLTNLKELLDSGNKAIILYGPPGTGKTYKAEELACQELGIEKESIDRYKYLPNKPIEGPGAWMLVQFHPNYTYEDFIGGISPKLTGDTLSYTLKEGAFKQFCDSAVKPDNENKKFIFIIDEINRADLSSVFGELMYALEYRGQGVSIPNFDSLFVIPQNVYVIGTMNSIDKSLVTFDLALRRRFAFYKIMPQLSVLESILSDYNIDENNLKKFISRCKNLNDKISNQPDGLQLGLDYQIGHAYFGKIRDFLIKKKPEEHTQSISSFDMERLWDYHIYPLLEEYLGNRIDDDSVQDCLSNIKDSFTRPL